MTGERRRGPLRAVSDGPRRVGDSLSVVARRLGPVDVEGLTAVFTRWEEIAGPVVAEHVRPVRVADGVLVVAADHPAWATQVRTLQAVLLAKVAEIAGRAPERLDVVIRPR
ncbi:MAG TPA: DUF721 domain-containing protein [Acidimicrobiales bacterium]|nr:DUF721 domain-containing protein [Acidimicrobiales bacterium]